MRTDDVLAQIDTTLDDWSVGPDAMRSNPASPPVSRPARVVHGGRAAAREILIHRLIERHGLNRPTALEVLAAIEAGRDNPHADLVRAEATAVMQDAMGQIREALRPVTEAMTAMMKQLALAFEQLRDSAALPPTPGRRPDRPAWQSPYGPALKRR